MKSWPKLIWNTIDLRVLAIVRIGVGTELLWDLAIRWHLFDMVYAKPGLDFPDPWYFWQFSWLNLSPSTAYRVGFFAFAGIAYLLLAIGYRTRWSAVASFLAFTSLASYSSELSCAEDSLCQTLLFWFCLLPAGARYSWDALLRPARFEVKATDRFQSPIVGLITLQLSLMYLGTGCNKLLHEGDNWRTGEAIWQIVSNPQVGWGLGKWLLRLPAPLLRVLTQSVPIGQILIAFLIWVPNRWARLISFALGTSLHLGIAATMWTGDVWFYPICQLLLCVEPGLFFRANHPPSSSEKILSVPRRWEIPSLACALLMSLCMLADFSDQNPRLHRDLLTAVRPPLIGKLETLVFRGQHWAMYTGSVTELRQVLYVADTNLGPVDVTPALYYPWYETLRPLSPDLTLHGFLANRMPLIHRRIMASVEQRLVRGCDVYSPFFDFMKRRYEARFPNLRIERIHLYRITASMPSIGSDPYRSPASKEARVERYATWTP